MNFKRIDKNRFVLLSKLGECWMVIVYLTKLKIARFRGIEEIIMEKIKNGTNLIVGPNDAGKTSILEAIKILLTLGKGVVICLSPIIICRTSVKNLK